MKRSILRILDLLIVIAFILLLYIVIEPQYRLMKINESRRKLQSNMFAVRAGVEKYIAFHGGEYPLNLQQVFDNLKELDSPDNPYSRRKMTLTDLIRFEYDVPADVEDDEVDGINGKQRGESGKIGVGFFIPMGRDSIPTKIGIIGFGEDKKPLIIEYGKKKRVVVLSG